MLRANLRRGGYGALREQVLTAIDQIERIEIDTYRQAIAMASELAPSEAAMARFSLPYVVATALCYGEVGVSAFVPVRLNDPQTRRLMARVTLREDAAIESGFPSQRSVRVRVFLADGRVLEDFQLHRKGDPEQPLSDAELESKFLSSATLMISPDMAQALLD